MALRLLLLRILTLRILLLRVLALRILTLGVLALRILTLRVLALLHLIASLELVVGFRFAAAAGDERSAGDQSTKSNKKKGT